MVTRAKKAIANFGLRAGMPVGATVTLRGARMYEFLDRFITLAIPRIRDFRGLPNRSFDGRGNYTFGIKEQMIFPEIDYDKVEKIHGMDITLVTSTDRDDLAMALLRELGWPFRGETPSEGGVTMAKTVLDRESQAHAEVQGARRAPLPALRSQPRRAAEVRPLPYLFP